MGRDLEARLPPKRSSGAGGLDSLWELRPGAVTKVSAKVINFKGTNFASVHGLDTAPIWTAA